MKKRVVILISILIMLMCGCSKKTYPARVNQSLENVVKIELLDTRGNEKVVLYTLADSEVASFWEELMSLKFGRYFSDPATEYGVLSVRIYYSDDHIDIIGTEINGYYSPSGESLRTGWYYAINREDFTALFSQYVDESMLPPTE